jgi:hypothetical protein
MRIAKVILETADGRIERAAGDTLYVEGRGITPVEEIYWGDCIDLGAGWRPVLEVIHVPAKR